MDRDALNELIGRKRVLEILQLIVREDSLRYFEIKAATETSSDTISKSLSILQKYDLVERQEINQGNVRYLPTNRGIEFLERVKELNEWISTSEE